jgi:ABC-type multidrug transport system ATPase subunit
MSVEIMELLNHINKANGTTIVMVTHAHDLVRQYDHRVVVLKEGEIIADGYDREQILGLINPDVVPTDAGFYNAPNEYEDVEKFIFTYGQDNIPIEETIPQAPEIPELQPEVIPEPEEKQEAEAVLNEITEQLNAENEEGTTPYSIEKDEDISSILAAFAASSAARTKKTEEAIEELQEQTSENNETISDTASEDNGGAV